VWVKIRLGSRRRGAQRADDEVAEAAVAFCDAADGLIDVLKGGYVVLQGAEVEKPGLGQVGHFLALPGGEPGGADQP
jgi:hypothetical protein